MVGGPKVINDSAINVVLGCMLNTLIDIANELLGGHGLLASPFSYAHAHEYI